MAAKRRTAALLLALGSALTLISLPAASAQTSCNQTVPTQLTHLGSSTQVVVATTKSWTSTSGSLRMYEKRAGTPGTGWCLVLGPYRARFGYSGLVPGRQRHQNSGTTPAGTYRLPSAFGLNKDPGTALPYVHSDANDYWALDRRSPSTFNTYQPNGLNGFRASEAEHIAQFTVQYRYVAVIGFNLPKPGRRANRVLGGAIFLHVNGTGPTAGCVSIYQSAMVAVLRRLDPTRQPTIVIAPTSWLGHA